MSRYVFSGWRATDIASIHSGFPFNVTAPYDVANTGSSAYQRPELVGQLFPAGFQQTLNEWFNKSALTVIPYTYGNMGRNIMRAPDARGDIFGLIKATRLTERANAEFRAEFFNLFNHPNFNGPNVKMTSASFGRVLSASDPRFIQFGLKLLF